MEHAFVTVVVPFDDRKSDAVNVHLDGLGNPARGRIAKALDESAFVHFISLTVVRAGSGGSAHLVLEASADGYPDGVLRRLAREIGAELRDVLASAEVLVPASRLGEFLVEHDHQVGQGWFAVPGVVASGTPGMTVGRIRKEAGLASRIQKVLDGLPAGGSALATLKHVREQLFVEGDYKWAFVAQPVPLLADAPRSLSFIRPLLRSAVRTFLWPLFVLSTLVLALVLRWQGFLAAIVALVALGAVSVLAAWFAYARFRRGEAADVQDDSDPAEKTVGEIMARENRCMQNHLAAVSTMKPGWLRLLTLRLALWAVGVFAAYRSRPGFLSNIGTIHFARWILLPGTDKLLFFSNYNGSWESYLEDFILRARHWLTGVWSNTQGFPRTKHLVQGGAKEGDRFKRWARRQQQPTRFWYSAYPELATDRVRINAAIRHGFATASTEDDAARWLVRFRFAPSKVGTVESDCIPTLVFGGLRWFRCARSLVLRLPDVSADARAWIAAIEPAIGYGEKRPDQSTLVLGLSASGLRKLGLDEQALSTFPTAFQSGMAAPSRARALGDVGVNAPDRWGWGGVRNEADAILNLYALSDSVLQRQTGWRKAQLRKFGLEVIHEILLDEMPPKNEPIREPFGFTDDISQPIVRGTRKWVIARNQIHVVEPGEMILGYPDNLGYIPSSPSAAGYDDLGRNGTYLVVRQLEQDKTAFDNWLGDAADCLAWKRLAGDPRVPAGNRQWLAEWIGAKMVGRWLDGTSLVRHPDQPGSVSRPGTRPDNDFLFGTEDPDGLRCPFGAHIRRVNPRESFDPGSEKQLAISNRHRIFRVGRRYGPQKGSVNPGLLFMCVNASIERQFEFVQQTYMLGSSFHGLENEIDSLVRRPGLSDVLTIPTEKGPLRLNGMGNFVTVRGGGYFFMPGKSAVGFLSR
jgi:deferrochelatase/peroxidase EfeB